MRSFFHLLPFFVRAGVNKVPVYHTDHYPLPRNTQPLPPPVVPATDLWPFVAELYSFTFAQPLFPVVYQQRVHQL